MIRYYLRRIARFIRSHKKGCWIFIMVILQLLILFKPTETLKIVEVSNTDAKLDTVYLFDDKITPLHIGMQIQKLHIKYPKIVLAQAILESGHLNSDNYLNNNNLFGMKKPYRRPTIAIGFTEITNYSIYKSWEDSIIDYALFQSFILSRIKSESEYFDYLGKHYAEDKTYVMKLKKIIASNQFVEICNTLNL